MNNSMHTREEKLAAFGRLLDIMDALREKCPWNAAQTMETIRPMTEEEVYELSDTILEKDRHGPEAGKATSAKEIADTWELVKAKEKDGNKTVMGGIPKAMPAMLKALSMQEKARGCGFDWEKKEDVWDKVQEEVTEVSEAVSTEDAIKREMEFGDLLFAVINAARLYGVDPEAALGRSAEKFRRRFNYIEAETLKSGRQLKDMTLSQMDALWDEAKAKGL